MLQKGENTRCLGVRRRGTTQETQMRAQGGRLSVIHQWWPENLFFKMLCSNASLNSLDLSTASMTASQLGRNFVQLPTHTWVQETIAVCTLSPAPSHRPFRCLEFNIYFRIGIKSVCITYSPSTDPFVLIILRSNGFGYPYNYEL
jgi:hypothetical protein